MKYGSLCLAAFCLLSVAQPAYSDSAHLFIGGFPSASDLRWTALTTDTYTSIYVTPGVNSWNGISSKVKLTKVTSGTYQISVNATTTTKAGLFGEAFPYCKNTSGVLVTQSLCSSNKNWSSGRANGYLNVINAFELNTSEIISMVYAHETGHLLSLRHYPDEVGPYPSNVSVMSSTFQSILAQPIDKNHLKEKWGT
jgi:hypothetical protein